MTTVPAIDLQRLRKVCSQCSLADLCLPVGLGQDDVEQLEAFVQPDGPIEEGEHVYRVGEPFRAIYAVRTGCLKSYVLDPDGEEEVLGFHLPGELAGLDAIYPNAHQCNAVALDTTTFCRLPYESLAELASRVPGLQRQIFRLMSKDIGTYQSLSGDLSAEERMAVFLLGLSERMKLRGYSPVHFLLLMPRRDIANYLRMATETVSRVLGRFQEEGLVQVARREIRLLDMDGLKSLGSRARKC